MENLTFAYFSSYNHSISMSPVIEKSLTNLDPMTFQTSTITELTIDSIAFHRLFWKLFPTTPTLFERDKRQIELKRF